MLLRSSLGTSAVVVLLFPSKLAADELADATAAAQVPLLSLRARERMPHGRDPTRAELAGHRLFACTPEKARPRFARCVWTMKRNPEARC